MNKTVNASNKGKTSTLTRVLGTMALGALSLLISCGDNVVEAPAPIINEIVDPEPPIVTTARLNVVVLDNATKAPVEGAVVTLLSEQGRLPLPTAANGYATFDDVRVGEHSVQVDFPVVPPALPTHASVIAPVNVDRGGMGTGIDDPYFIAYDKTVHVPIYPLTASVTGQMFYKDDNGESQPAVGAKIRLTVAASANVVNSQYDVAVDATGTFTFVGLPAGVSVSVQALNYTPDPLKPNTIYPRTTITSDFQTSSMVGDVTYLTNLVKDYGDKLSSFRYLGNSTISVEDNETIVFEFSEELDAARMGLNPLTFFPVQPVDVGFVANTIVLTPYEKWNGNFTVSFAKPIVSVNGDEVTPVPISVNLILDDLSLLPPVTVWLDTTLYPTALTTNIPQWTSTLVPLRWRSVAGATKYEIYRKAHGEDSYVLIDSTLSIIDTTKNVALTKSGNLENKKVAFVVRAANSRSKTPLTTLAPPVPPATSPELVIAPVNVVSSPTVTNTKVVASTPQSISVGDLTTIYTHLQTHLSVAAPAASPTLGTFDILFTEPMKMVYAPPTWTGTITATQIARIGVACSWPDNKTFRVTITAAAGDAAPGSIDAHLILSGFEPITPNGGVFFIEYTVPDALLLNGYKKVIATDAKVKFTTTILSGGHSLSASVDPPGAGTLGGTALGPKTATDPIAVTVSATAGYYFVDWTPVGVVLADPTNPVANFAMPANAVTLKANFAPNPHMVTVVSPVPGGSVSDLTTGNQNYGATITATAAADANYVFSHWTPAGVVLTTPTNYIATFSMPDNPVTLTPVFSACAGWQVSAGGVAPCEARCLTAGEYWDYITGLCEVGDPGDEVTCTNAGGTWDIGTAACTALP